MLAECSECERLFSEYSQAHQEYIRLVELRLIRTDLGVYGGEMEEAVELSGARRRLAKHNWEIHRKSGH